MLLRLTDMVHRRILIHCMLKKKFQRLWLRSITTGPTNHGLIIQPIPTRDSRFHTIPDIHIMDGSTITVIIIRPGIGMARLIITMIPTIGVIITTTIIMDIPGIMAVVINPGIPINMNRPEKSAIGSAVVPVGVTN